MDNPKEKIEFGPLVPPKSRTLTDDFWDVAGVTAKAVGQAVEVTGKMVSYLAKEFFHAVGPAKAAGLIVIGAIAAVGYVAMESKVTEVFKIEFPTK